MATIEILAKILESISVTAAGLVAIAGVRAWRREFVGKRRIELAEETLAAFYAVLDSIEFIRFPLSSPQEGATRKKGDNEDPADTEMLNQAYVTHERYEARKDVIRRFTALKYRFMAAFGKDAERVFINTVKTIASILNAANTLGTLCRGRQGHMYAREAEIEKRLAAMQKQEDVVWDFGAPEDAIRTRLNDILADIERITAPVFENKPSFWGLVVKWFQK